MKRLFFFFFMLVIGSPILLAQSNITTIILVRHAEKDNDGTSNPGLSATGKNRAMLLAKLLDKTSLDAIYSTNYKRTMDTVEPVAKEKNIKVELYDAFGDDSINNILNSNRGKTILIVGHSNNIPRIANLLTGTQNFVDWKDQDYDNLLLVSFTERGTEAKVMWLQFGVSDD
jgi:broad specificity phosphatase PhoE